MQNVIAFANNDVVTVAWTYGKKLTGCMGFAVYRIATNGKETPLPAMAVFKGKTRKPGQTCLDAPFQKFYWKDVYARLVAEKTGERKFRYKVVPLTGTPGKLVPMHIPQVVSNEVEISATIAPNMSTYFNRGLLSTQMVSRAFKGKPSSGALLPRIADEEDALRASLSGDMVEALTGFVARAKSSGSIYAALYELHDEELIKTLEGLGGRLHIVLSNSMKTDEQTKKKFDDNDPARKRLAKTAGEKFDRLLPNNQIGHNKFLVYCNAKGAAKAVLFGSTNWTPTGLCAQTNNTVIVEDDKLAARYLAYWKQLASDTKAAMKVPKQLQGSHLRSFDSAGKEVALAGIGELTSWFSPNTPKLRPSNHTKEKVPGDMAELMSLVKAAKHAVLFLVFYPGTPSIANWAAVAQKANRDLFVRGCVTNPSASEGFYYQLHGMTPPKKVKGQKAPKVKSDARVIAAAALGGKGIPAGWNKELLKAGFAIVHDKIVVIDPFSDDCVVVTGSHNLGHKASYNNDENLAIVRGNRRLAEAYATHVLDVYDHFSWRYMVQNRGQQAADQSLESDPDKWQAHYFDDEGKIKVAQLKFWLSALS
jgi:PLD-like domain